MKKIIQLISFAFIAVVVSVVSVKAQSAQRFNADIPFAFSVGGKTYDAGRYKVKVAKPYGAGEFLTLLNSEGKVLDVFAITSSGESGAGESSFVFEHSGHEHTLTKIVSTDVSYELPKVGSKRRATLAEKRERSVIGN